ncbi:MAG: hypothetical protein V3T05_13715 [Myxococcota bacterium]
MPAAAERTRWVLICHVAFIVVARPAQAHQLGRSYSDLRPAEDGAQVLLDFDPSDFDAPLKRRFDDDGSGRIEPAEMQRHHKVLGALAAGGYAVYRGGERCRPEVHDSRASIGSGLIRITLWYACAKPGRWRVDVALAERMRKGHVHFLSVRSREGIIATTLSHDNPTWLGSHRSGAFGASCCTAAVPR